jgi:integrase
VANRTKGDTETAAPRAIVVSTHGSVSLVKRSKWYYVRFRSNGRRPFVGLGLTNKVASQRKAAEIDNALANDQPWEWIVGRSAKGDRTFNEVANEFLAHGCDWGDTTRRGNRALLKRLNEEFGAKPVTTIRQADVEGYLARRRDEGMSRATSNRYTATLKSIFKKATEWGFLPHNPVAGVKTLRENLKQPMPLTLDEVERLLAALEPPRRCVAEVYLQTGMRLGELKRLQWADVDFEAETLALRNTKNHTDRTVPMSRRVHEIMAELKRQNIVSDTPSLAVLGDAADILADLKRAAERAGFEEGRSHRLQHRLRDTAATTMLDRGVALDRVQAILGHKVLAMTRRYAATRDEHLRAAVAQAFDA